MMSLADKLNHFREYLESQTYSRFEASIAEIDKMGIEGPSVDEYQRISRLALSRLNASFTNKCDDIAYSSLFNRTIGPITMPPFRIEGEILIESTQSSTCTQDSNDCTYASAA